MQVLENSAKSQSSFFLALSLSTGGFEMSHTPMQQPFLHSMGTKHIPSTNSNLKICFIYYLFVYLSEPSAFQSLTACINPCHHTTLWKCTLTLKCLPLAKYNEHMALTSKHLSSIFCLPNRILNFSSYTIVPSDYHYFKVSFAWSAEVVILLSFLFFLSFVLGSIVEWVLGNDAPVKLVPTQTKTLT